MELQAVKSRGRVNHGLVMHQVAEGESKSSENETTQLKAEDIIAFPFIHTKTHGKMTSAASEKEGLRS